MDGDDVGARRQLRGYARLAQEAPHEPRLILPRVGLRLGTLRTSSLRTSSLRTSSLRTSSLRTTTSSSSSSMTDSNAFAPARRAEDFERYLSVQGEVARGKDVPRGAAAKQRE